MRPCILYFGSGDVWMLDLYRCPFYISVPVALKFSSSACLAPCCWQVAHTIYSNTFAGGGRTSDVDIVLAVDFLRILSLIHINDFSSKVEQKCFHFI